MEEPEYGEVGQGQEDGQAVKDIIAGTVGGIAQVLVSTSTEHQAK